MAHTFWHKSIRTEEGSKTSWKPKGNVWFKHNDDSTLGKRLQGKVDKMNKGFDVYKLGRSKEFKQMLNSNAFLDDPRIEDEKELREEASDNISDLLARQRQKERERR